MTVNSRDDFRFYIDKNALLPWNLVILKQFWNNQKKNLNKLQLLGMKMGPRGRVENVVVVEVRVWKTRRNLGSVFIVESFNHPVRVLSKIAKRFFFIQ